MNDEDRGQLGRLALDDYAGMDPQELAFELWAFKHSRNATAVARELDLPGSTVRDWVTRYDWDAKHYERLRQLAPHLNAGVVVDAVYARSHAWSQLRNHLNPEHPYQMQKLDALAIDLALKHAPALIPDGLTGQLRGPGLTSINEDTLTTAQATIARIIAERNALTFRKD